MGDYEDLCNESADELEAAHARIEALTKRVGELEKAALAYRDLSTCYRLGKRPSENLFARLDRARKALEKGVT